MMTPVKNVMLKTFTAFLKVVRLLSMRAKFQVNK